MSDKDNPVEWLLKQNLDKPFQLSEDQRRVLAKVRQSGMTTLNFVYDADVPYIAKRQFLVDIGLTYHMLRRVKVKGK